MIDLATPTQADAGSEPGFSGLRRLRLSPGGTATMAGDRRAATAAVRTAVARQRDSLSALGRRVQQLAGELPAAPPQLGRRAGEAAITPEQRLVQRITLGVNQAELARVERLGYQGYLEEQLAWEELPGDLDALLEAFLPSLTMSPGELWAAYREEPFVPVVELWVATLLRSLYSPRQLLERMVLFWSDHFNIDIASDLGPFFKPVDDREVVRRHALGRFPELLSASAHSPAMLSYLTNDSNFRDHPNENYARELMELHTLGADNGYSQQDVREVARCFTGWVYYPPDAGPFFGQFVFYPPIHDFGRKTVLGETIPAGGGASDGETVLALLATHPETARFVARKLLRYFWGYEPPEPKVEQLAGVYADSGGDLRSMLRTALRRPSIEAAPPKLKRPYHFLISCLRALFAGVEDPGLLIEQAYLAGQLPFTWRPPDGFPDDRGYWSDALLPRWNFATLLMTEGSGVALPAELGAFFDPSLRPAVLTQRLDWLLTNGSLSQPTRAQVRNFLANGPRSPQRLRQAVALALASPEMQDY